MKEHIYTEFILMHTIIRHIEILIWLMRNSDLKAGSHFLMGHAIDEKEYFLVEYGGYVL